MASDNLTASETRIFQLLEDGHPHRMDEMKRVLGNDEMEDKTVYVHICNLRRKLRPYGQDVSTELATTVSPVLYRLRRLTASHARA